MLVRLLKRFPGMALRAEIRQALANNLTEKNLAAEAAFFDRPGAKPYERPYGWAWLLKLDHELHDWDDPQGRAWRESLAPLVATIQRGYLDYYPKQTYPTRSGVHSNTAFGLAFTGRTVGEFATVVRLAHRSGDAYADICDARAKPMGVMKLLPILT